MGQLRLKKGLPLRAWGKTPTAKDLIDQLPGPLPDLRPAWISNPTHPYGIKNGLRPASRSRLFFAPTHQQGDRAGNKD